MNLEQYPTGSLLLWKGESPFSRVIRRGQKANFPMLDWSADISHVGMLVQGQDVRELAPLYEHRTLTFESTTLNEVSSALTGQLESGVDVVPLDDKLHRYNGACWVRPLMDAPPLERLVDYIRDHVGRPYEQSYALLAASALNRQQLLISSEDHSSMFCSETYVDALEYWGVLDERSVDSDAMCPAEVARLETHAPLLGGASLGSSEQLR